MSKTGWLPIRYESFYDVPRLFFVEVEGSALAFDCPFDDASDDYREEYSVYRLDAIDRSIDQEAFDWRGALARAVYIGRIPVVNVRFDETRRCFVAAETVSEVQRG